MTNARPRIALPVLAPPIRRDTDQAAANRIDASVCSVLASADPCAHMTGLSQQMCYAQQGDTI